MPKKYHWVYVPQVELKGGTSLLPCGRAGGLQRRLKAWLYLRLVWRELGLWSLPWELMAERLSHHLQRLGQLRGLRTLALLQNRKLVQLMGLWTLKWQRDLDQLEEPRRWLHQEQQVW